MGELDRKVAVFNARADWGLSAGTRAAMRPWRRYRRDAATEGRNPRRSPKHRWRGARVCLKGMYKEIARRRRPVVRPPDGVNNASINRGEEGRDRRLPAA